MKIMVSGMSEILQIRIQYGLVESVFLENSLGILFQPRTEKQRRIGVSYVEAVKSDDDLHNIHRQIETCLVETSSNRVQNFTF